MPYIPKTRRPDFDSAIRTLAKAIKVPGELNYVISQLINTMANDKPSYALFSQLVSALECAKLEFYRRRLVPYEGKKISENGDVIGLDI